MGISINNEESDFFLTGKGVQQGDPLSPTLFNLVVYVFTKMLSKAAGANLIQGLASELIPQGVICLQYADNTIVFLQNDTVHAENLKWIMTTFELILGMRINYHKSKIILVNMTNEELNSLADIFGCPVGVFPIKYLGIPLRYEKLSRNDLQPLIDKIIKRIAGWRGKLLSHRGRLVLIKTCLASIPIYVFSFFKFPSWAIEIINSHMAHCLWDSYEGHNKIHLANWDLVSMKKEYGGVSVPNLKDLN